MKIGIIAESELGGSLAHWWALAGHQVVVGTAGGGDGADVILPPGRAPVTSAAGAAAFGEVIFFAPEWSAAHAVVDATAAALAGKPVLDATNPVVWTADHGYERALPDDVNGLQELSHWAPDAQWVKAFNTVTPNVMARRRGRDPLLTEFICTDSRAARAAATRLIHDVGFAPFFAGGCSAARLTETGGPLRMREVDVVEATAVLAEAMTFSG